MPITKVSTGLISSEVASTNLNIDDNTLFIDVSTNRVGVGNLVPSTALDVTGTVTADGLTVDGNPLIQGAQPYITLTDSVWTTGAILRSGVNTLGTAIGDYFLINAPSGKGVSISTNNSNNLATFANTGDISFYDSAGTTAKFFWDASAESLGIGTTSPVMPLDVMANTGANALSLRTRVGDDFSFLIFRSNDGAEDLGGLAINRTAASTSNLLFYTNNNGSATERMRIDASGLVGIGTDSPVQKLSVSGDSGSARFSLERSNTNTTGGVGSIQWNALDGHAVAGIMAYGDGDDEGAHIVFNTTSAASSSDVYVSTTERMRITSSGQVKIANGGSLNFDAAANGNYDIAYKASDNTFNIIANSSSASMGFHTNSTERMRIDADGDVGIGTDSPSSVLSVKSDINNNSNNGILFEAADSTNKLLQLYENSVGECYMGFYQADVQTALIRTNGASYFNGGNVGIGISIPSERLNLAQSVPSTYTAGLSTLAAPAGTNLRIENNSTVTDTFTGVLFVPTNGAEQPQISYVGSVSTGSGLGADIVFGRRESSTYYAESMRIDASGDLNLVNTGLASLNFTTDGSLDYARITGGKSGSGVGELQFWTYSGGMFRAATIDSGGNLLVGQSSTTIPGIGNTTAGVSIRGTDGSFFSRSLGSGDTNNVVSINRSTADGPILGFQKDGTTVGSINTEGGDMAIGNNDVGLQFINGGQTIRGFNMTTNARIDAQVDLGMSTTRFKDLYLSEGINLSADDAGGVGSNTIGFKHTNNTAGYAAAIEASYGGDFRADLIFKINTSQANIAPVEVARFNKSGNLLVGATTAADVSNLTTNHLFEGGSSTAGSGVVGIYNNTGTASCPALVVLNRDASTDSSNRFIQFYADVTSSTVQNMGGIVGNGVDNVQFASISDVREKTNIESISGSLDKINALNPVEFDWIASGEHVNAGFVAQEVEQVFPEFVVENMAEEGAEERKGLTGGMTGGIVAHLVKAIQEQNEIINDLRARVAALES